MNMHMCATYEVTAINHETMGSVQMFDIYDLTAMVSTLHIYILLHCYHSAPIDPTMVHTSLKQLQSNGYKCKKINMAMKCKLTTVWLISKCVDT